MVKKYSDLIKGRDEIKIWLRYPSNDRNSISDIENTRIKTVTGQEFPLNELQIYHHRGKGKINHIDGKKEVRVYASLIDAELSGQVNGQIERDLFTQTNGAIPSVEYQIKGQAERAQDSGIRLSCLFNQHIHYDDYLLNFKSFYQSRLILMVVPIGIFSALLGHGIVGKPFSTLSVWGVVALVGILVNDAVVTRSI